MSLNVASPVSPTPDHLGQKGFEGGSEGSRIDSTLSSFLRKLRDTFGSKAPAEGTKEQAEVITQLRFPSKNDCHRRFGGSEFIGLQGFLARGLGNKVFTSPSELASAIYGAIEAAAQELGRRYRSVWMSDYSAIIAAGIRISDGDEAWQEAIGTAFESLVNAELHPASEKSVAESTIFDDPEPEEASFAAVLGEKKVAPYPDDENTAIEPDEIDDPEYMRDLELEVMRSQQEYQRYLTSWRYKTRKFMQWVLSGAPGLLQRSTKHREESQSLEVSSLDEGAMASLMDDVWLADDLGDEE